MLHGEAVGDYGGRQVQGGGDVDGDGLDDLLVGAYLNDDGGNAAGKAYLVLGDPVRLTGTPSLATVADASWIGEHEGDYASLELAIAPDIDGDGLDDLLIGAYHNSDGGLEAGKVYLVYGRSGGWNTDVSVGTADASFLGTDVGDHLARSVGGVDDADGDGRGDWLVGGCWNSDAGYQAGKVYLMRGGDGPWAPDSSVEAEAGASFVGEAPEDWAGRSVSAAGDVDGDGLHDLLIGAYGNDDGGSGAGKAYLVLGRTTGWQADADLGGFADAAFTGEATDDRAGLNLGSAGDMDDDGTVYPGALEVPYDGVDQDCDGVDLLDADGDGYDSDAHGGDDCDDGDPAVHPGAMEVCNGLDDDCDPVTDEVADLDVDGYSICAGDCDDDESAVNPGAVEVCNGLDDDCDPMSDENSDGDGDGISICGGDCDDDDGTTYLGAPEQCDGVDNDCDGHDGGPGPDCDDGDPDVHPDAEEIPYDGVDNDCDDGDLTDVDGDGHDGGDGPDCDDADPQVHPGAGEDCTDGVDNDCDGAVDGNDEDCGVTDDDDDSDCEEPDDDSDGDDNADDDDDGGEGGTCRCTGGGSGGRLPGTGTALLLVLLALSRRASQRWTLAQSNDNAQHTGGADDTDGREDRG